MKLLIKHPIILILAGYALVVAIGCPLLWLIIMWGG